MEGANTKTSGNAKIFQFSDPNLLRQASAAGGFNFLNDPHAQARLAAAIGQIGSRPAYSFKIVDGGVPTPTSFPPDAQKGPGIPT